MRQRALARGWTLNEYRLEAVTKIEGRKSKVEAQPIPDVGDERDLYRALGLDYVEPELREDRGEIAAAENHTLPELMALENLRGTFHNHTVASDGRCTLEEMANAAMELGLAVPRNRRSQQKLLPGSRPRSGSAARASARNSAS
jgi:DNA polymerase (family 10)